jgi:tripartite ATP-independent transporter DctM subunit
MSYIGIRCWKNPQMGPPLPPEERVDFREKMKSLSVSILPIILIFLVLGLIYLGVATPSEAGGVGAVGALICAAIYRNLTWKNLQKATTTAIRITAMLMWLLAAGAAFSQLIGVLGVQDYLRELLLALPVSPWAIVVGILFLVFILGMFIDATPITVIFLPIFYPIVMALGFDLLWFGLLFTMDLLVGIMTPPFGMVLFYFKGLNLPGVTMMDIYRAIVPFFLIMMVVMVLVFIIPELAIWLPNQMIK